MKKMYFILPGKEAIISYGVDLSDMCIKVSKSVYESFRLSHPSRIVVRREDVIFY